MAARNNDAISSELKRAVRLGWATAKDKTDYLPPPHSPLWPTRDDIELPDVKPLPLVDPKAPWIKRVLAAFTKRTQYRFTLDYFTYCPILDAWIFIPLNFVYDMASVPLYLAMLFRPAGIWAYPAGPHDMGYRVTGLYLSPGPGLPYRFVRFSREDLDRIFKDLADKSNNLRRINQLGYRMLRIFGTYNWQPVDIKTIDWLRPVMPPS